MLTLRLLLVLAVLPALTAVVPPLPSAAPASCATNEAMAALLVLLPDRVGLCSAAATTDPATGDLLQPTSGGLLVFRQSDQRAAFTDGDRTWVVGPGGLSVRPDGERFPWEPDAAAYPAAVDAPHSALPGEAAGLPPVPDGVVFPGHLLIADRFNRRVLEVTADATVTWQFPPAGQAPPPNFGPPDDAFYTPGFRTVVANSEDGQTVTAIDIQKQTVRWQAGTPGWRGAGRNHFNSPDDAVPAQDGTVMVADIRNCRLVHLAASGAWLGALGSGWCRHQPPTAFALPNGAFPTADGGLVVTEIQGSWVDRLNADGTVRWSVRAPVVYPSDALAYPDGSVLLTDYSWPGQVVRLAPDGRVLWRFAPRGPQTLNHPSIAIPLAANRVAICDDERNRILVVDPTTNAVVWQYAGPPGSPLRNPDGLAYRAG